MDAYLLSIGWWNFFGSFLMLFFLHEPFGQKMLNEWTKIYCEKFTVNYWVRLWLFWAAGINVFFGLVNVMAVKWGYPEIKLFLTRCDIVAYTLFFMLAIWGYAKGKLGDGAWSVFVIFSGWIGWGIYVLYQG
jgi:hypothetical protein